MHIKFKKKHLVLSIAVICVITGVWLFNWRSSMNTQELNALLASGKCTVIVADNVYVRDEPTSHSIVGKLRTLELTNPTILSTIPHDLSPSSLAVGSYLVLQIDKAFAEQVTLAIYDKTKADTILAEKGIHAASGIPSIIIWPSPISPKVDIYRLNTKGVFKFQYSRRVTHILIN